MILLKPYDWALDNRSLVYNPPRQKYLCPQGHECYETNKDFMKNYVWCSECEHKEPYIVVSGIISKGLYIPIHMCEKKCAADRAAGRI